MASRSSVWSALAGLAACLFMACGAGAAQVGGKLPDFELVDHTGIKHTLAQYAGRPVILVFWSFKCPLALAVDGRLRDLFNRYGNRIVMLAVASNANESPAEVEKNARNLHLPLPVLLDKDGLLAENAGATHTPTACIIDGNGILRHRGALDPLRKGAAAAGSPGPLDGALEDVLAGRAVSTPETRQSGCTIRRKL